MFFEEQPISIKSCIIDIAYDYTKKRHVFRLITFNGSEYLFQADRHEEMLKWIQAIQENNNPDEDVRAARRKQDEALVRVSNACLAEKYALVLLLRGTGK